MGPHKEAEACTVTRLNTYDFAAGTFPLQIAKGLLDVVGVTHEAQKTELFSFRCDDPISRQRCLQIIVAGVVDVEGVTASTEQCYSDQERCLKATVHREPPLP